MKPVAPLIFVLFALAACAARRPASLPELTATDNEGLSRACAAIFPPGPFQFVHAIDFTIADGSSTVIGVTSLAGDRISSVLMTVEGFTLFAAAVSGSAGQPEVSRAVPPFDRPGFAAGLLRDVRLIFRPPAAAEVRYGRSAAGPLCRYFAADGRTTDILPSGEGCWRILTYTPEQVPDRTVTARSCREIGGVLIPEYLELRAFGPREYTLKMTLITADNPNRQELP